MIIIQAVIPMDCIDQMVRYGLLHHPNEACGLLMGKTSVLTPEEQESSGEAELLVEQFIGIPNTSRNPRTQFVMDPSAILPYVLAKQSSSRRIVGIMHTHPLAPALPSREDLSTAWRQIPSHWILSFSRKEAPEWGVFQYVVNETAEQPHYKRVRLQIND